MEDPTNKTNTKYKFTINSKRHSIKEGDDKPKEDKPKEEIPRGDYRSRISIDKYESLKKEPELTEKQLKETIVKLTNELINDRNAEFRKSLLKQPKIKYEIKKSKNTGITEQWADDKLRHGHELAEEHEIPGNARPLSENQLIKMDDEDIEFKKITLKGLKYKDRNLCYIIDGGHLWEYYRRKGVKQFEVEIVEGDGSNSEDVRFALNTSVSLNRINRPLNMANRIDLCGKLRKYHDKNKLSDDVEQWLGEENPYGYKGRTAKMYADWYEILNIVDDTDFQKRTLLQQCDELNLSKAAISDIKENGIIAMGKYRNNPYHNDHLYKYIEESDDTLVKYLVDKNDDELLKSVGFSRKLGKIIRTLYGLFAVYYRYEYNKELSDTFKGKTVSEDDINKFNEQFNRKFENELKDNIILSHAYDILAGTQKYIQENSQK